MIVVTIILASLDDYLPTDFVKHCSILSNSRLLKNVVSYVLLTVLLTIGLSFLAADSFAQGRPQAVQLSGLVLGEDSTSALPGVNVYVPAAGRGTSTNQYGYFSMPGAAR